MSDTTQVMTFCARGNILKLQIRNRRASWEIVDNNIVLVSVCWEIFADSCTVQDKCQKKKKDYREASRAFVIYNVLSNPATDVATGKLPFFVISLRWATHAPD